MAISSESIRAFSKATGYNLQKKTVTKLINKTKQKTISVNDPLIDTLAYHASGRSRVTLSGANKLTPVLCKEIRFEKGQADSCHIIHTLESP